MVFTKTASILADNSWRYKFIKDDGTLVVREASSLNEFVKTVPNNATGLIVSYPGDSKVKIVKGNKATTGWSPAPEDVDAKIDSKLSLTGGTLTGNLTAPTFIGALSGNASTATTLKTARNYLGAII